MKKDRKQKKIIFIAILMVISFIIGGYILYEYILKIENDELKEYMVDNTLLNNVEIVDIGNKELPIIEDENVINENVINNNERINKLKKLQLQNSDIVGWLEIPNTDITRNR